MKTVIPAPTPPTKVRPIKTEHGEDIAFSPELKALLESSEKPTSETPHRLRMRRSGSSWIEKEAI